MWHRLFNLINDIEGNKSLGGGENLWAKEIKKAA